MPKALDVIDESKETYGAQCLAVVLRRFPWVQAEGEYAIHALLMNNTSFPFGTPKRIERHLNKLKRALRNRKAICYGCGRLYKSDSGMVGLDIEFCWTCKERERRLST